jgi:Holliday junction resolvase-like predicted endonuclease
MRSRTDFGEPFETVGSEKRRRVRRAAAAWLAAHPQAGPLEISFEVLALGPAKVERIRDAF